MKTTLVIAIAVAAITALVTLSPAHAKGPLSIEVTGGNLDHPVTIEGPIDWQAIYPPTALNSVNVGDVDPDDVFVLQFFGQDPQSGERYDAFTLLYYPPAGDRPAAIKEGSAMAVPATDELRLMLETAGVGVDSGEEGGLDLAWFLLPGGIAGLVLLGGAGGRYFLKKHR